jgi:hypothetical protein
LVKLAATDLASVSNRRQSSASRSSSADMAR